MIYQEFPAGKGYADILFKPRREASKPPLLVELKWDMPAGKALRQIEERQYLESLVKEGYSGNVLLVGISYDKSTKEHTARIEETWV